MNCAPFDLRDLFLGELAESERRQTELHVRSCPACRHELERLGLTRAALVTLPDEEIPQRIAFVSDKVFEPSRMRRFLQAFWGSAARLGFASAAMLSLAILVFTLSRPAPVVVRAPATTASLDRVKLEADLAHRIDEAVRKAVAESDARQAKHTVALLAAAEKRHELDRQAILLAVENYVSFVQKRMNVQLRASNDTGIAR